MASIIALSYNFASNFASTGPPSSASTLHALTKALRFPKIACVAPSQRRQFRAHLGTLFLVSQIFHLQRIGLRVKQHRAVLSFEPKLSVAEFFRTHGHAMQARAVFAPNAVRRTVPFRLRTVKQRNQALAFNALRQRQTA